MPQGPNDRIQPASQPSGQPRIYTVINGQRFPRPGLETFFARTSPQKQTQCSCDPVVGVYCQCNKICTCNMVCRCVGHHSCSCVDHRSGGGGTVVGCRCAPVH